MQVCPRCQRTNPAEAAFCYFDGVDLRATAPANGQSRADMLPRVFASSGRKCTNLTELAVGCLEEWEAARELLSGGKLGRFLVEIGRPDLAKGAKSPAGPAHADTALDAFLQTLPGSADLRPRLDLNPRRLHLGTLSVGEEKRVRVQIQNSGKGMLHGKITVAQGSDWLRLDEAPGGSELAFRTAATQAVTLVVATRGLSSPHKYSGKLTLVTNGGVAELPVRLDLGLHAFPKAPFLDVTTPRELADRMRKQPRQAVPLLESGEIARWFSQNGWIFPVQGKPAQGIAAVQQFFEGMGLSKSPVLALEPATVELRCLPNERPGGQFILRTDSKKWVYATAHCQAPWLRITAPDVSGPQQAVVSFEVDSADLDPDEMHEADIKITGNSSQVFTGRVCLTIEGETKPPAAGPAPPWLVGAAAAGLARLVLAVPADFGARYFWTNTDSWTADRSPLAWAGYALEQGPFLRHFVLLTWWIGALAGASYSWRKGRTLHDILRGAIAGAAGGLALSATLACLTPVVDAVPIWLWRFLVPRLGLAETDGRTLLWLALWVAHATLIWAVFGFLVGGLLARAGQPGIRFIERASLLVGSLLRWMGFRTAATHFVVR